MTAPTVCPNRCTAGTEPHPRQPVTRCRNCKEHLPQPLEPQGAPMADQPQPVIRERSTADKLRYCSQKLVQMHDHLRDGDAGDIRVQLLGIAMVLDSAVDSVASDTGAAPDAGMRCVCGDPIQRWEGPGEPGWIHSPGSDTRCLDARPGADAGLRESYAETLERELTRYARTDLDPGTGSDVGDQVAIVLAVRDRRMEQLAAGRETWKRKGLEVEADRDRLAEDLLKAQGDVASEALRAERAEATVARVRAFFEDMATWCSPRGVAADYAQRGLAVLDQEQEGR